MVSRCSSPPQDYQQNQVDFNQVLIKDRANTVILRVHGDSMEGEGIYDQDEIIGDCSFS